MNCPNTKSCDQDCKVGTTKTFSLAKMEMKVNIFLNKTQFRHSNRLISSQSKGLCVTRDEGKHLCDR